MLKRDMDKRRKTKADKLILTKVLPGLIIVGLGLMCFALINIARPKAETQSAYTLSASGTTTPKQSLHPSVVGMNEINYIAQPTASAVADIAQSAASAVADIERPMASAVSDIAQPAASAVADIERPTETIVSGVGLYPLYPSVGDVIGTLMIPVLNLEVNIIEGTGSEELKKGAGHFLQSVLPGEKDNCVISGHRDTIFSELGELKTGDLLIVQASAGTFTYQITGTRIVEKDDRTVIVPTDHAVLTLTTCYPFIYVGHAPQRYIVSADLVASE